MINYSFIIPHRNVPDLLNKLLDSIPNREDIEVIVIDDNSDEGKKPSIARPNTKVVLLSKENSKGAGHARNVGLDMAQGKWLLFADSDDVYVDGFISYLDQYVDSCADIVLFSAYINYIVGEKYDLNDRNYIEKTFDSFYDGPRSHKDIIRVASSINAPWNKMFCHHFINNVENRFEEIPISNDAWFVKNAGVNSKTIEIIDKRLYCYMNYPDSISYRRRPLSHYYQAIDSNTRRNILLRNNGLRDLIEFPGFNKNNILRDFGKCTYVKLFLYKLFTDPTYFRLFITKSLKRVFCYLKFRK